MTAWQGTQTALLLCTVDSREHSYNCQVFWQGIFPPIYNRFSLIFGMNLLIGCLHGTLALVGERLCGERSTGSGWAAVSTCKAPVCCGPLLRANPHWRAYRHPSLPSRTLVSSLTHSHSSIHGALGLYPYGSKRALSLLSFLWAPKSLHVFAGSLGLGSFFKLFKFTNQQATNAVKILH